jgi:hypothetical protein
VDIKCRNKIFVLILLSAFVACKPSMQTAGSSPAEHPDSVFASLKRSPCFGRCPAFTAVIYNNGKAEYEGRSSAVRQGLYRSVMSETQMKAIQKAASDMRLDTLNEKYINEHLADFPPHSFSILINGSLKHVYVMDTDPPSSIEQFEKLLESEIEKLDWKKVEQTD